MNSIDLYITYTKYNELQLNLVKRAHFCSRKSDSDAAYKQLEQRESYLVNEQEFRR